MDTLEGYCMREAKTELRPLFRVGICLKLLNSNYLSFCRTGSVPRLDPTNPNRCRRSDLAGVLASVVLMSAAMRF